jgi:putative lipoprotein
MMKHIWLFVLVSCSCTQVESPETTTPEFDEASFGGVWHQAKLRGVSFRAIGQEPGWLLEIADGSEILLVTDTGQTKTSYPYVEPNVFPEERRTRFFISDYAVEIIIEGKACRDSMSGEKFAVTVTVTIGEDHLSGCGRVLY